MITEASTALLLHHAHVAIDIVPRVYAEVHA